MTAIHDSHLSTALFRSGGWKPARTERVTTFGKWKDFVHDNFPWLEHRNHSAGLFEAEVSAHRFGCGELSTIRANASEVIRTRHLSEVAEDAHIKLMWQIQGSVHLEQDSRQCVLDPVRPQCAIRPGPIALDSRTVRSSRCSCCLMTLVRDGSKSAKESVAFVCQRAQRFVPRLAR